MLLQSFCMVFPTYKHLHSHRSRCRYTTPVIWQLVKCLIARPFGSRVCLLVSIYLAICAWTTLKGFLQFARVTFRVYPILAVYYLVAHRLYLSVGNQRGWRDIYGPIEGSEVKCQYLLIMPLNLIWFSVVFCNSSSFCPWCFLFRKEKDLVLG